MYGFRFGFSGDGVLLLELLFRKRSKRENSLKSFRSLIVTNDERRDKNKINLPVHAVSCLILSDMVIYSE